MQRRNNQVSNSNSPMDVSRLRELAVSQEGFAFDPITGEVYNLNDTAMAVLRCLQKGMNADEVLGFMLKHYDVDRDELGRDVEELMERLRSYRLLP